MDRERLDGWCERGILWLVLAILVFTALFTGAVRPQDFVVVQWLTVALVVVWGIRFWINPKHRLLWSPLCWAVVVFVAYAVSRYLKADIEYVARQELIRILVYTIIFFAVLTNLHRQDTTQIVAMTLIVLAAVISMYAVVQFLTESDRVWHFIRPASYAKRGSGTFICPNNLAGYLEMILPLGLAYTMTGRFEHVCKVLVGYCSLVIFTGIAVSVSRGGWLATTLTLMVFFFWLMRQRDYRLQAFILLAVLVAIAVVFFVKAQFSQNRNDRLVIAVETEDIRFMLWQPATQMWKDHFWWGVGPAHFDYRFREYRPAHDQLQARPDRVHNDYLNTLVDWGLVGGVLVAVAWVIFYWEVFRTWKYVQRAPNDLTTKRSNKTSVVLGGALGLLAILFHSFVDFNMHIPANAILAVTLMALVAGHFRFATERYWVTLHAPLRSVVTVILLAALAYLGKQTWHRTIESHWLVRAAALTQSPSERMAALRRSFAAESGNFETAYEIGEILRLQSWQGGEDYKTSAEAAMKWFQESMKLNPYDPYGFIGYGMCLHWLGRHAEAEAYFKQAEKLDPNGYYTQAHLGWHYVQRAEASDSTPQRVADYEVAKKWFEQSLRMKSADNPIAVSYLEIVNRKLAELAASK